MPGSENEYRGWKIRIHDKAVDTEFSARIEVWMPGHDPRSHTAVTLPFLKRVSSPAEAQAIALEVATSWIDKEVERRRIADRAAELGPPRPTD
jgi:hypothetical protein